MRGKKRMTKSTKIVDKFPSTLIIAYEKNLLVNKDDKISQFGDNIS